ARLDLVPQSRSVSDDFYRYIWVGRVQVAGINPYRYAPNDPAVGFLRDSAIYPDINRKPVRTIYPPVAQGVFRVLYVIHPNSVAWTKLAFSLLDLLTAAFLVGLLAWARMRPERVLLYAWHPLLILEVAHSGHIDSVAALFIVLALYAHAGNRFGRTGVLLACATLVKLYALVALPAFLSTQRRNLRLLVALLATTALMYAPFLSVGTHVFGFLPGYVREEGISSGARYYFFHEVTRLAAWLPGNPSALLARSPLALLSATTWYEGGIIVAMMACAVWCWLRPAVSLRGIADRAALLFIVLLTLATPSQPWYVLLLLACVPLVHGAYLLPTSIVVGSAGFGYLYEWFPNRPAWPLMIDYDGRAVALVLLLVTLVVAWRAERGKVAGCALSSLTQSEAAVTTSDAPDAREEDVPALPALAGRARER
ncbi:MAG: glycosyltransferase 87 family protein, partial [Thermomicrobiales bacterium]